jgi:hypothetical protein
VTRPGGRRACPGLAVAGAIGLSLLASACGSSAAKVAQVGTTGSARGSTPGPLTFAACMRSHGVPNFPDADSDGRIHAAGIDKNSPAFRAAHRSGERPAPAAVLAFAACIRPGPVAGAFDREQEVVSSLDHPDRARAGQPEHPEPVVGVRLYERGRTVSIGQAYAGVLNAS